MSEDQKGKAIGSLSLVGKVSGEVRRLSAFDKKRHTIPDKVNGATQAFLEKLCEEELLEEAEALFQSTREAFGYRRKEITLEAGAGYARLETKDFVLELRYELDPEDPSSYSLETSVRPKGSRDLLESDEFGSAVGVRFDRLRCGLRGGLRGGVSVESVIDAVEGDESGDLTVDYPSDCSHCVMRIREVDADVFVDGAVLEVRFGKMATAGSLMQAFEGIGSRFGASAGLSGVLP